MSIVRYNPESPSRVTIPHHEATDPWFASSMLENIQQAAEYRGVRLGVFGGLVIIKQNPTCGKSCPIQSDTRIHFSETRLNTTLWTIYGPDGTIKSIERVFACDVKKVTSEEGNSTFCVNKTEPIKNFFPDCDKPFFVKTECFYCSECKKAIQLATFTSGDQESIGNMCQHLIRHIEGDCQ